MDERICAFDYVRVLLGVRRLEMRAVTSRGVLPAMKSIEMTLQGLGDDGSFLPLPPRRRRLRICLLRDITKAVRSTRLHRIIPACTMIIIAIIAFVSQQNTRSTSEGKIRNSGVAYRENLDHDIVDGRT